MKYKLKLESPECFLINGRNDVREIIVEREEGQDTINQWVCNCSPENFGIEERAFSFNELESVI